MPAKRAKATPARRGRKVGEVRWTLSLAASEFGLGTDTLRRKLSQAEEMPGEDGMYSTRQIASAVFNNLENEKIRLTRAQADRAELELAQLRREVVTVASVVRFCVAIATAIRQKVSNSQLSQEDSDKVLRELEGLFNEGAIAEEIFK